MHVCLCVRVCMCVCGQEERSERDKIDSDAESTWQETEPGLILTTEKVTYLTVHIIIYLFFFPPL